MTLSMVIAVIGAVTGALGIVTASIAIIQTRKANQLAKDANTFAKESNRIAKDSKRIASKANGLAAEANKISGDANSISQRALSVAADQTVYDWRFKFNKKSLTLAMTNGSPNTALNVTVTVRHENKTILEKHIDKLTSFETTKLKSRRLTKTIADKQRETDRKNRGFETYIKVPLNLKVDINIVWTSALGRTQNKKVKMNL